MTVGTTHGKATTMKLNHSLLKLLRILYRNGRSIMHDSYFYMCARIVLILICVISNVVLLKIFFLIFSHFVLKHFICHVFKQVCLA